MNCSNNCACYQVCRFAENLAHHAVDVDGKLKPIIMCSNVEKQCSSFINITDVPTKTPVKAYWLQIPIVRYIPETDSEEYYGYRVICSNCHRKGANQGSNKYPDKCPHCGAEMSRVCTDVSEITKR